MMWLRQAKSIANLLREAADELEKVCTSGDLHEWPAWEPIDTAPRDGKAVLVTWEAAEGRAWCRPAVWQHHRGSLGPGWTCYYTGHHLTDMTHWMPLPPHPRERR